MIRYRYGRSIWEIGHQWYIDWKTDKGSGLSIWDSVYRYGHPGYRYGISYHPALGMAVECSAYHSDTLKVTRRKYWRRVPAWSGSDSCGVRSVIQ